MPTTLSTIDEDNLKIRWEEPYVSEALNKVSGSLPAGIVHGFRPLAGGGLTLTLQKNAQTDHSAMRVRDTTDGLSVLYWEEDDVMLDLTAHVGTTVYIGVTVDYDVGSATTALIRAYSSAEYAAGVTDAVWICGVAVPGVGAIAIGDIDTSMMSRVEDERWNHPLVAGNDQDVLNPVSPGFYGAATATISIQAIAGAESGRAYRALWISGTSTPRVTVAIAPVTAAEYVLISWKQKTVAASGTIVGVLVEWFDLAGTLISDDWYGVLAAASTLTWTPYGRYALAPANAVWCGVSVGVEAMTAGTAYFDRVMVRSEDSGTRKNRQPIVGRSFLNIAVLGKDPTEYGTVYFDSDDNRMVIGASSDEVFIRGNLEVDANFTLANQRRTKRWAGYTLKQFVEFYNVAEWVGNSTILRRVNATVATTFEIPLEDLPIGAVITQFGIAALPNFTDAAAVLSITLFKQEYAPYAVTTTTKGLATVTGSTAATGVTHTVELTDGAAADEVRVGADDTYFLRVGVDNGNTANNWEILKVWFNYRVSLQTPADF